MRILYLTHRLPYAPNRGDRIRAYYTLKHLASRHEVDLLSFVHDREEESHAADLADLAASVTTVRIQAARKPFAAGAALFQRRTLTHALLDAAGFNAQLNTLADRGPDVVLAFCSGMARFAMQPRLAGVPWILDMVDVDSGKWTALADRGRGLKRWIYRREAKLLSEFEGAATAAAEATLVVNTRERTSLRQINPSARIEVVENGIDVNSWRPIADPASEPRVVFCGVMNYEPNETAALWLMREVWPEIRRARPDATLTLAGANPTRRLHQAAQRDPSIEVTGFVTDVRPFLWKSAVSVAPLAVARGLQNKVLEATAAGLPSVVTRAVREGLPLEAMPACVQADSPAEFVRETLRLLSIHPAERRAIAGRANLTALSWASRLSGLDAVLADLSRPARLSSHLPSTALRTA
jgi:sugar transferase (PEP-CTERM/EpsH1 system associated)